MSVNNESPRMEQKVEDFQPDSPVRRTPDAEQRRLRESFVNLGDDRAKLSHLVSLMDSLKK